jgi:hypothetical protein
VPPRHQLAFQGFVLPAAAVVSRTFMDQLQGEHRQARRVRSNELLGASYIVFECGTAPTTSRRPLDESAPYNARRSDVSRESSASDEGTSRLTSLLPRTSAQLLVLGRLRQSFQHLGHRRAFRPTPAGTLPHPLAAPRTRCPSRRRGSSGSACPIRPLLPGSWPGTGNSRRSLPCSR